MTQAQKGDTVTVHYKGLLENGEIFDSSEGRPPLEFKLGAGEVIPGFEEGILGMEPGESKKIDIPSEKAYGEYNDELVLAIKKEEFPQDINPEVGDQLEMQDPSGRRVPVIVKDITDEAVLIDVNSPLAGKDLTFEVELVDIKK